MAVFGKGYKMTLSDACISFELLETSRKQYLEKMHLNISATEPVTTTDKLSQLS